MIKAVIIFPIKLYQLFISPLIGANCRFYPSCSHYMIEAIEKKGIIKGVWLGVKRLSKCHPGSEGGFDPVPTCSCDKNKSSQQD